MREKKMELTRLREKMEREQREKAKMLGKKEGIIEIIEKMIFIKYRKQDCPLLKQCNQQQLDQIFQTIMLDKDYQDIEKIYHMKTSIS